MLLTVGPLCNGLISVWLSVAGSNTSEQYHLVLESTQSSYTTQVSHQLPVVQIIVPPVSISSLSWRVPAVHMQYASMWAVRAWHISWSAIQIWPLKHPVSYKTLIFIMHFLCYFFTFCHVCLLMRACNKIIHFQITFLIFKQINFCLFVTYLVLTAHWYVLISSLCLLGYI